MSNEGEHNRYEGPVTRGSIEVICGPMFSGKTEELMRRVRRATIAGQKVCLLKHASDDRYNATDIVSHSHISIPAEVVRTAAEIAAKVKDANVLAVDEAQFFDSDIADVARKLAQQGVRVILAGIDMDYRARPFGPMPVLLATAEYITKLTAICTKCGMPAGFTYRKSQDDAVHLVGHADIYEARCRQCYDKG